MEISDFISVDNITFLRDISSKKRLLETVSALLSEKTNLDKRVIFDVLMDRERLGSTALGDGIAIPHGKFSELEEMVVQVIFLDQGIDFDAADGQEVNFFIYILVPNDGNVDYLKYLGKISEFLSLKEKVAIVREINDSEDIIRLFTE